MTGGLWPSLGVLILWTAGFAGVAYVIRAANAKKSAKDHFVGWVVFTLCVGGFFAAGACDLFFLGGGRYWIGTAFFGFLVGLASGHVIGRFVWRYYQKEIEGDEDTR